MTRSKKIGVRLLFFALLLIWIYYLVQWKAKIEIGEFLSNEIPEHITLKYDDLGVNLLFGDIILKDVTVKLYSKGEYEKMAHTELTIRNFQISGFSYLKMLLDNTINIKALSLDAPKLIHYSSRYIQSEKSVEKVEIKPIKNIRVGTFAIHKGSFNSVGEVKDSSRIEVNRYDLKFFSVWTDSLLINEKIPFKYDGYELKASDILFKIGKYENLAISEVGASEELMNIKKAHLYTKYGKNELSKYLNVERDYIDLLVPETTIKNLDLRFMEDRFRLETASIMVSKPTAEIYRDKLIDDDLRVKPLYARLLRNLPIEVDMGEIAIENGYLSYEEKVNEEAHAGMLFFDGINASITHVSNLKEAETTKVTVHGKLMGKGQMQLNWEFDVNAFNDNFLASGSLKNLDTSLLNPFFEPNLQIRTQGTINQMYFTISGNEKKSIGDMKMKYEDFKFNVLDSDRLKVNKLLTAIGNIFLNDGSKTDLGGFRYGKMEVERHTTKSFYNYLWLNVRDGMLSTLTGNGKKRK